MARLNQELFHYKCNCFKNVHFRRYLNIANGITPPYVSIIHDINDFETPEDIGPNINDLDWLYDFDGTYQLAHNTMLNEKSFKYHPLDDKIRVLNVGVNTRLNQYRSANMKRMRMVTNIAEFPAKSSMLNVMNHHPLFKVRLTGVMQEYRLFNHLLYSMFDKIMQCPDNYQHYIPIRLKEKIYTKADFFKVAQRGFNSLTVNNETDPLFFLLSELLCYSKYPEHHTPFLDLAAWDKQKIQTLSEKEADKRESILERINFIFYTYEHACIYSIKDLVELLQDDDTMFIKFLRQLEFIITKDVNEIESGELVDPTSISEAKEEVNPEITRDTSINVPTNVDQKNEITDLRDEKIKTINAASKVPNIVIQGAAEGGVKAIPVSSSEMLKKEVPVAPLPPSPESFLPRGFRDTTPDEPALKSKAYIEEPMEQLITSISKDYTEAQKKRLREKAYAYKSLKIDGKKIVDIIDNVNGMVPVEPKKLTHLADQVADPGLTESTIVVLDEQYHKKLLERDILVNAVTFNRNGVFLVDIKKEVKKNKLEDYTIYTLSYEDASFKKQPPVKIQVPNVREDNTIISRGSVKKIYKQRFNRPICKVAPTKVALYSEYNKSLVQLTGPARSSLLNRVTELLVKKNKEGKITFKQGRIFDSKNIYPLDLAQIAAGYRYMVIDGHQLNFNLKQIPYNYETGMWNISPNRGRTTILMDMNNTIHITEGGVTRQTNILSWICEVLGVPEPETTQWTELGVINKDIPIGIILAYRMGLSKFLQYLDIDYEIYETGKRDIPKGNNFIRVKLADVTIVAKKYPLKKSFIFAGLNKFDLSKYTLMDLDDKEVYYGVFNNNKIAPSYLLEIDNIFDFFMDNATYETLVYMKEPTTVEGVLLRATELVTTTNHRQPSSVHHHRSRTYGKIPAYMYNEMSKQIASSRRNLSSGGKFSIHPQAVFQRVLQDALTENADINNPIGAIKDITTYAYTGWGGRTPESFVIRDRVFPEDGIGVISADTVDSSNVAIRSQYTMNANIVNLRGIEEEVPIEDVDAAKLFSVTGCLYPMLNTADRGRIFLSQVPPMSNCGQGFSLIAGIP